MREILFKAKRIDNGEWVEGYLFETNDNSYIAYNGQFDDDLFLSPQNIFIPIDKSTICQYTGLTDKNGDKIWENDLIECKEFSKGCLIKHFLSQVEWDADGTGFTFKDSKFGWAFMDSLTVYECEVIGNIFDNPELLEGGEKE